MRVAVGSDHAGFELKSEIVEMLRCEGFQVIDLGTCSTEPVDYPRYAVAVAQAVRTGLADRGILLCGSGVGASVAANKLRGIRAALCHDCYSAHQCVEHDGCNVLCLGPRVIGPEPAKEIVLAWLAARFSAEERHVRRLAQIHDIEEMEALGQMSTTESGANPARELLRLGQSVWMDSFRRGWIESGELRKMIDRFSLRGVTTNPSIFQKAIMGGADYDDAIRELVGDGKSPADVYEALIVDDVRMAADVLRPIYDETDGVDGFVSIELPPALANDAEASIAKACEYREKVGRENILVKVPGVAAGAISVEELIYRGINVNVTLLFSIESYERVAYAYIRGLERRAAEGKPIDRIASVASFFVSRIDTAVDARLDATSQLRGKAAVANAKLAYQRFKAIFAEPRFKALQDHGAREQRVLWASTSSKDPSYSDVYYVQELIGPRTVDTMPTATAYAFADHGKVAPTVEEGLCDAQAVMSGLAEAGIDFAQVTTSLEVEGIQRFQQSVDEAMKCITARHAAVQRALAGGQTARLGDYQGRVDYALASLTEQAFVRRLWEKDASLWKQGPAADQEIRDRLGWLDVARTMQGRIDEINAFVDQALADGFTHAVILGMGGSSLSPDVSRLTFGARPGYLDMMVLDSTVPAAVREVEDRIDLAHTLFIVSTKSGGTIETLSAYRRFLELVAHVKGADALASFVAITDPGSSLEKEARDRGFRKLFTNFPDIGGRYSALSYFGLVPAALIGVDIRLLLRRAMDMLESSAECVAPADNPGVVLGTIIAELAQEGRDKLTLLMSPRVRSLGYWIEQLVAESTGKLGVGVVPVESESAADPALYGDDRLFVYITLAGDDDSEQAARVAAIEKSGQPVVRITMADPYDLGQEYYRWEIATATACALLGVNAFDQPNVQESKTNTMRLLQEIEASGALKADSPLCRSEGVSLYCDESTKSALRKMVEASSYSEPSLLAFLAAHLDTFQPGDYFALMAFVHSTPEVDGILQQMRICLRDAYSAATTLGYGPRFLHSTGQLHKGGPNSGVFIQFTADDAYDAPIPDVNYGFSLLKQAQSTGDAEALQTKGRRMLRIHLSADVAEGLRQVLGLIRQAVAEQSA